MTGLYIQLLGIPWMDPNWLLDHFHTEFVWISLVIVFIECGLLFPFLPGDTLLFAFGLFLATDKLNLTTGPNLLELLIGISAFVVAAFLGNVVGYEIGRAIGHPCGSTTVGSSRRSTSTARSSSSRSTAARRW